MSDNRCGECGALPAHPGSVVRVIGRTRDGREIELCSRCFISREREAAMPAIGKMPPAPKKKRKR